MSKDVALDSIREQLIDWQRKFCAEGKRAEEAEKNANALDSLWQSMEIAYKKAEQDNAALREKVKVLEKCKTRITFDAPGAAEMVKLLRDNNAALRQRISELEAGEGKRGTLNDM